MIPAPDLRRLRRLQHLRRPQHQHPAGNRRVTRAFHQTLRLSIVLAPSGLVLLTERSCATAAAQRVAQDLRFCIATTSSMCSAPTPNGGGGTVVGQQQVLWIHAAGDLLPRLRRHLCRSLRITRAFHPVLRLSIATVTFGLVLLTERSCAMVSQRPAPAL